MIIINSPLLADAAENNEKYSTLLLSFFSLMKSKSFDNAYRLTSIFPGAEEITTSGEWIIPLVPEKLYIRARIDFDHSVVILKSIFTTSPKEIISNDLK